MYACDCDCDGARECVCALCARRKQYYCDLRANNEQYGRYRIYFGQKESIRCLGEVVAATVVVVVCMVCVYYDCVRLLCAMRISLAAETYGVQRLLLFFIFFALSLTVF